MLADKFMLESVNSPIESDSDVKSEELNSDSDDERLPTNSFELHDDYAKEDICCEQEISK